MKHVYNLTVKLRRGKLFAFEPPRILEVDKSNFIFHSPSSETSHDRPPTIHIDSIQYDAENTRASLSICIAHFDGTVQKLTLQGADRLGSFLAPISASSNGKAATNCATD